MANRAVIVGTGAGGLATAGFLAKSGWDVLALDQSSQLGGYLNPFVREGFQFDPGVHYVGEARRGGALCEVLAGLGIDAERTFAELDPGGFDVYRFPGAQVSVCRGLERYRDRLAEMFPKERDGLAGFFGIVEALGQATHALDPSSEGSWRDRAPRFTRLPTLLRWRNRTFGELLASKIRDPHLRSILAAGGGDYGLPPGRASALVGAGLLYHYASGAFFPRGGSAALRDGLVAVAERHGARFRTSAAVGSIEVRDRKATAVVLESGERIEADVVVSDIDPVLTYGRLIDPALLPDRLLRKVRGTEPSTSMFTVFLGMRRDLRAHGLGAGNVWDYPDWDIDAYYARSAEGPLPEPLLFLSPNSLKDDTGRLAPEGCSTLEIITGMSYARFERFRGRPLGDRGPEYEAEKRHMTDWLLEAVERRFPGLLGDIVVQEASTPLTLESYTRSVRGAAYGPAMTPKQFGLHRFSTTTPIPNLFLAGAGVLGDGVALCLQSGRIAARAAIRHAAAGRFPLPHRAPRRAPIEARP